jgi:hypothetical protein
VERRRRLLLGSLMGRAGHAASVSPSPSRHNKINQPGRQAQLCTDANSSENSAKLKTGADWCLEIRKVLFSSLSLSLSTGENRIIFCFFLLVIVFIIFYLRDMVGMALQLKIDTNMNWLVRRKPAPLR